MILDNYRLHLTYKFYKYAQKYKIELFALPLHSKHFIQLLDIGFFKSYKHHHSQAINKIIQTRISKFGKLDILANFTIICVKNFKKSTIFSVFRKTGLIFYNPEIVL